MEIKVGFSQLKSEIKTNIDNTKTFNAKADDVVYIHGDNGATFPPYEGAYNITPKIAAQILPTAQKSMHKDMVIEAIPYAEVKNIFNGKTVTIG